LEWLSARVNVAVSVGIEDPDVVIAAACALYDEMDALTPSLRRDFHDRPELALQAILAPRRLVESVPGVSFVEATTLVEVDEQ